MESIHRLGAPSAPTAKPSPPHTFCSMLAPASVLATHTHTPRDPVAISAGVPLHPQQGFHCLPAVLLPLCRDAETDAECTKAQRGC